MAKRAASTQAEIPSSPKKSRMDNLPPVEFKPNKIATAEVAAKVDKDAPLSKLLNAVKQGVSKPRKGECVVYWMRLCDLRVADNKALSRASAQSVKNGLPLIVIFVFSLQDWIAHDRGARRIDFALRNLKVIKESLAALNIPLLTTTHETRSSLPARVLSLLNELKATSIFANIEYEVDELRRDILICQAAKPEGIQTLFLHDRCVVEPGVVQTKENKNYGVYSPFQRTWLTILNDNLELYLEDCPSPKANPPSIRDSEPYSKLFDLELPSSIPGFELEDSDGKEMERIWPAGEDVAAQILDRFLHTKARKSQFGSADPLTEGAETSSKQSRVANYKDERDMTDKDTTSRLSPYLTSGVISARACIRAVQPKNGGAIDGGKTTGIGRWVQEVAWRDFYIMILATCPRVSMGRPYNEKFADVKWEDAGEGIPQDSHSEQAAGALQRWKDGKTGVPIVDAAMRCMNQMGWLHNRMRMITAMYLTKDLLIDWRLGERYFMETLIDADLASNNGGWQWTASCGVDSCPYFRIFNPYTQSAKADPQGDFIRSYVPELAKLRGKDIHNPSADSARALGYPRPMIDHAQARERALRRYKNPGEE